MCRKSLAVVGLIKGKKSLLHYYNFLWRNYLIKKNIKVQDYDTIVFHEGDIQKGVVNYVRQQIPEVSFIDVGGEDFWRSGPRNSNFGYKNMCSFYTYFIWKYLDSYKYVLRLDDDSFIHSNLSSNMLDTLQEKNINHVYVRRKVDTHLETADTLPKVTKQYVDNHDIDIECNKHDIDNTNFYSNFYITRLEFWKQNCVQNYLKYIVNTNGIYRHRWGDSTIHAHALKMFSNGDRIIKLPSIRYEHGSHGWATFDDDLSGKLKKLRWATAVVPKRYWTTIFS